MFLFILGDNVISSLEIHQLFLKHEFLGLSSFLLYCHGANMYVIYRFDIGKQPISFQVVTSTIVL